MRETHVTQGSFATAVPDLHLLNSHFSLLTSYYFLRLLAAFFAFFFVGFAFFADFFTGLALAFFAMAFFAGLPAVALAEVEALAEVGAAFSAAGFSECTANIAPCGSMP